MKFRNKKTGEEYEAISHEPIDIYFYDSAGRDGLAKRSYYSLAELNEEWEDYKPAESPIKDEKIRKAIRAWAEACAVSKVMIAHPDFETTTLADISDPYKQISFSNERAFLPMGKEYTIAELCGEEAPEPKEPSFIDLDERIREKEGK